MVDDLANQLPIVLAAMGAPDLAERARLVLARLQTIGWRQEHFVIALRVLVGFETTARLVQDVDLEGDSIVTRGTVVHVSALTPGAHQLGDEFVCSASGQSFTVTFDYLEALPLPPDGLT
jgi:hypothetical protein